MSTLFTPSGSGHCRAAAGILSLAFVVTSLLAFPGAASAQPSLVRVVDQEATGSAAAAHGVSNFQSVAQTFEVGVTGMLTHVELWVSVSATSTDPLLLDIQTLAPTGIPSGAVIASLAVPTHEIVGPGYRTIDLGAQAIHVTAGESYAIVLRRAGSENITVKSTTGYGRGRAYGRLATNFVWDSLISPNHDVQFRTYILPDPRFIRGDLAGTGVVNIGSAVQLLSCIFINPQSCAPCEDTMDLNDDGVINIADPIYLLSYLFGGGPPPPAPFPACGTDPTPDTLTCTTSTPHCALPSYVGGPTCQNCLPIQVGVPHAGVVGPNKPEDWLCFTIPAHFPPVTVVATGMMAQGISVSFFDANCNPIGALPSASGSHLTWLTTLGPGDYRVVVHDLSAGALAERTYSLDLQ